MKYISNLSVLLLLFYAQQLGVENKKWHFLTGDQMEIWALAEKYLTSVRKDAEEPGGIYHSGKILLKDSKGHIRGLANGTDIEAVDEILIKIEILLKETKDLTGD